MMTKCDMGAVGLKTPLNIFECLSLVHCKFITNTTLIAFGKLYDYSSRVGALLMILPGSTDG